MPFNEKFHSNRIIGDKEEELRQQVLKSDKLTIATYCFDDEKSNCINIVDDYFIAPASKRLMARRMFIATNNDNTFQHTRAIAESPIPLTKAGIDSRKWRINKKYTTFHYSRELIIGPFLTGTMEINTGKVYDILLIGLAGGLIPSYFSTMNFVRINMTCVDILPITKEIAINWFGFKETDSMKISIDDGVNFIKDASKNDGRKYDVIIIDAVGVQTANMRFLAPPEDFLDDEMLIAYKKLLKSNGTFMMNVLYKSYNEQVNNQIMSSLLGQFIDCYQEFGNEFKNETVVYCGLEKGNNPYNNPYLFVKRYEKIRDLFAFRPTHIEHLYEQWLRIKHDHERHKQRSFGREL